MQELELKFAIGPDDADRLRIAEAVAGSACRERRVNAFETVWFDTPRYRLKHRTIDFRITRIGGRCRQTLKRVIDPASGGMLAREEYPADVQDMLPDLAAAEAALFDIRPALKPGELTPVFRIERTRTRMLLDWNASVIELAIDIGRYQSLRGRPRTQPLCELELELFSGDAADLFDLALELRNRVALRQIIRSKSDHGFALVSRSFRPQPVKFKRLPAPDDLSPIAAQLGLAVRHYLSNDPHVLDDKLEAIHQARVALRRARAVMRAHKSLMPWMQRRALNVEIKWLQTEMGFARDWQVFCDEVLPDLRGDDGTWTENIAAYAEAKTAQRLDEAVAACTSRRAQITLLHVQKALAGPFGASGKAVKARGKVFRKDLRALIAISDLPGLDDPEAIHAIRILGKKLRYVMDLAPELKTPETKPLRKEIKKMQDLLGRYNDLCKALELFASAPSSAIPHTDMLALRQAVEARQIETYDRFAPRFAHLQALASETMNAI